MLLNINRTNNTRKEFNIKNTYINVNVSNMKYIYISSMKYMHIEQFMDIIYSSFLSSDRQMMQLLF